MSSNIKHTFTTIKDFESDTALSYTGPDAVAVDDIVMIGRWSYRVMAETSDLFSEGNYTTSGANGRDKAHLQTAGGVTGAGVKVRVDEQMGEIAWAMLGALAGRASVTGTTPDTYRAAGTQCADIMEEADRYATKYLLAVRNLPGCYMLGRPIELSASINYSAVSLSGGIEGAFGIPDGNVGGVKIFFDLDAAALSKSVNVITMRGPGDAKAFNFNGSGGCWTGHTLTSTQKMWLLPIAEGVKIHAFAMTGVIYYDLHARAQRLNVTSAFTASNATGSTKNWYQTNALQISDVFLERIGGDPDLKHDFKRRTKAIGIDLTNAPDSRITSPVYIQHCTANDILLNANCQINSGFFDLNDRPVSMTGSNVAITGASLKWRRDRAISMYSLPGRSISGGNIIANTIKGANYDSEPGDTQQAVAVDIGAGRRNFIILGNNMKDELPPKSSSHSKYKTKYQTSVRLANEAVHKTPGTLSGLVMGNMFGPAEAEGNQILDRGDALQGGRVADWNNVIDQTDVDGQETVWTSGKTVASSGVYAFDHQAVIGTAKQTAVTAKAANTLIGGTVVSCGNGTGFSATPGSIGPRLVAPAAVPETLIESQGARPGPVLINGLDTKIDFELPADGATIPLLDMPDLMRGDITVSHWLAGNRFFMVSARVVYEKAPSASIKVTEFVQASAGFAALVATDLVVVKGASGKPDKLGLQIKPTPAKAVDLSGIVLKIDGILGRVA